MQVAILFRIRLITSRVLLISVANTVVLPIHSQGEKLHYMTYIHSVFLSCVIVWKFENYCTIYKTNEQNCPTKRVSKPKLLPKLRFTTCTLTVITLHIQYTVKRTSVKLLCIKKKQVNPSGLLFV